MRRFAFVIGLILAPLPAAAQTTFSNSTGNSLWSDPLNWTNGVPDASDIASIRVAATITLPPDAVASQVRDRRFIGTGSVVLTGGRLVTGWIDGAGSTGTIGTLVASDVGSLSDVLFIFSTRVTGTIGDGLGGGDFDVYASNSRLGAPVTITRRAILPFSTLDAGASIVAASEVDWVSAGSINASASFPTINRLPDSATSRLFAASINFNAGSVATTDEVSGPLKLMTGRSRLRLTGPASGSLLWTAQALQREPGTLLTLETNATSQLRFLQSPTGPNGALPTDRAIASFGVGSVSDGIATRTSFLTYDTGMDQLDPTDDPGLRPLDWNAEYTASLSGGGNVRVSGAQSIGAPVAFRSLNITDGSLDLAGADLTISSGGLIIQGTPGSAVTGTGALVLPGEGIVMSHASSGEAHSIDVPIHAASLTKGGSGNLILTRPNFVPGTVYMNEGVLTSRAAGALGSGALALNNGTVRIEQVSQSIARIEVFRYTYPYENGFAAVGVGAASISVASGLTATLLDVQGQGIVGVDGEGLVLLPQSATSTADFSVYSGELRVDGTLIAAPVDGAGVSVRGGRVSGRGNFGSFLSAGDFRGGVISPGPGVAHITTGGFSFGSPNSLNPDTILEMDFNGPSLADYDQIVATDHVGISRIVLDLSVGYAAQFGDSFTIIDNRSPYEVFPVPSGTPEGFVINSAGYAFRVTYVGGDGNDVVLTVVPEPAVALYALALTALRRRRRI